jgi:UDP-3-O-[3-hydroxymyristoyl] glucosamine N-acyltransferase
VGNQLARPVSSRLLAERLGVEHVGPELLITSINALDAVQPGALCFSTRPIAVQAGAIIIATAVLNRDVEDVALLMSESPRFHFAVALSVLLREVGLFRQFGPPLVGSDCRIKSSAHVGSGVVIGNNTQIGHNVVIEDGVSIGSDCVIKSNTIIGDSGFGYVRDPNGLPIEFPHIGSVSIGNRVMIGNLVTVCRATLGTTVVEDDVKIDDHVHIAHNCFIGKKTMIAACAEVSGGVRIDGVSWLGPNCSVREKVSIGASSLVGIGANVTGDVPAGAVVYGNPAKARQV